MKYGKKIGIMTLMIILLLTTVTFSVQSVKIGGFQLEITSTTCLVSSDTLGQGFGLFPFPCPKMPFYGHMQRLT